MNQPQETDLCAFIRKDIEITQKLIDDQRFELQHPEILTHDVVVRLNEDLERRGKLLDSFKDALYRCRAENRTAKVLRRSHRKPDGMADSDYRR